MLLQLLGRGCAHVPRFGNVGVSDRSRWPIVILLSNDIRHDLSSPLRSRCLYTWLDPPTPCEEVQILHARAPLASPNLVGAVTRLINCIRRDMPAVRDKPGLRESIDLIEALVKEGIGDLTTDVIDQYLCFLGKRHKEWLNLRQGLARLETAARRADDEIDEWVELAFYEEACMHEQAL
jgi:MoxR-like ATPase